MAAASSQLAEIENQIVVDQISKSIADISSGTLQELPVLCSEEEWLKAKLQRDVSLVKRAAWSTMTLHKDQITEEQSIGDIQKKTNYKKSIQLTIYQNTVDSLLLISCC